MEKIKFGPQTLFYPAVSLIGANVDGKPNFMTVSYCGSGARKPPTVTFPMNKFRYTLRGIRENGTFSMNFVSGDIVQKADYCGIYSGRKRDKSQIFKVFYGILKTAPLIQESHCILECKAIQYVDLGSHILIVGEVFESYLDEDCLTDGKPDLQKMDPLIYSACDMKYRRLGDIMAPGFAIGREPHDDRPQTTVLDDCLSGR